MTPIDEVIEKLAEKWLSETLAKGDPFGCLKEATRVCGIPEVLKRFGRELIPLIREECAKMIRERMSKNKKLAYDVDGVSSNAAISYEGRMMEDETILELLAAIREGKCMSAAIEGKG
jgi:hypothetical protein